MSWHPLRDVKTTFFPASPALLKKPQTGSTFFSGSVGRRGGGRAAVPGSPGASRGSRGVWGASLGRDLRARAARARRKRGDPGGAGHRFQREMSGWAGPRKPGDRAVSSYTPWIARAARGWFHGRRAPLVFSPEAVSSVSSVPFFGTKLCSRGSLDKRCES